MPENVEIERRFLVDGRFERPWVHESTRCIEIKQWYLDNKEFNVSSEQSAVMYENKQLVSGLSQEVCSTSSGIGLDGQNPKIRVLFFPNTQRVQKGCCGSRI